MSRAHRHAGVALAASFAIGLTTLAFEHAASGTTPPTDAADITSAAIEATPTPRAARDVVLYVPDDPTRPHPVVVALHGMCDTPEAECEALRDGVTGDSWLACPRAPVRCAGGGSTWGGSSQQKASFVSGAVARVEAEFPGLVDGTVAPIVVGFSAGAYLAIEIAHREGARLSGLVLIGAKVQPNAALLRRAGVRRVLLAAGDFDGARAAMREAAAHLAAAGIEARFQSTGRVGHQLPPEPDAWIRDALAWVRGDAR